MNALKIGSVGQKAFTLPLDVATQAMAIHGVRGKGKTVTASVVVEELLGQGVQVVVIDPTDSWWGLKSSADGKRAGHPVVILGGPRGDLPLTGTSGRVIADFAVERGASMVLSLRHMRKGEAKRFVMEFAEQLFHRKGEPAHRTPLFLVIDECSQYVPQRVMGEDARLVGAIQDCVRMGRNAGLGVALIDQRPATVHKDVLTQVELLVCHAVTSPQDRKALDEWIKGHDSAGRGAEFLEGLASLGRGEAWFWFPAADVFERVRVRMRTTFDSSKTPKLGETPETPERVAEIDLDALRDAMEATVAEAEANDPKVLKKRIRELEKEIAGFEPLDTAGLCTLEDADDRVREAEQRVREELAQLAEQRAAAAVQELRSSVRPHVEALHHALANGSAPRVITIPAEKTGPRGEVKVTMAASSKAPRATRPRPATMESDALPGPHRRILAALAWLEVVGVRPADTTAVAFIAGYRPKGGAFNNPKGALRSMGLIEYPTAGTIELTEGGRARADTPETPHSIEGLHQMVLGRLDGPERRILEPLLAAYPDDMDVVELAEAAGYAQGGGAFNNPRGRLRTLGLIDYPRQGRVVACDVLFPEGLR